MTNIIDQLKDALPYHHDIPLYAATAHPTQSDVSCSRAREGGTE